MSTYQVTMIIHPRLKGCMVSDVEIENFEAKNRRALRQAIAKSYDLSDWTIKRIALVRGKRPYVCCCCNGVGGHFWQTYCYSTEQYDCGDEPCHTCSATGRVAKSQPCRSCRETAEWEARERERVKAAPPLSPDEVPF